MRHQSRSSLTALAWRNIWRHKRRSWLTIMGLGFSSFLLAFMVPMTLGSYDMWIELSARLYTGYAQVQQPGYQERAQIHNSIQGAESLAEELRNTHEYEAITVRANGYALVSSGTRSYGAQVVGVQVQTEPKVSFIPGKLKQGRYLSADDANELVLGAALARNLRVGVGDELTLLGSGKQGSMAAAVIPVVGIYDSGDPNLDRFMVQLPLDSFQQIFNMGDSAHNIVVIGKKSAEVYTIPSKLKQHVGSDKGLVVLDWAELLPGIESNLRMEKVSGIFFILLLTAIVVFSIFNTFLMSILERTKEFGLMLALGARPRYISGLVMLESILLTLVGLLIGIIAGTALNFYYVDTGFSFPGLVEMYESMNIPITGWFPRITPFTILFGPGVMFVATILAAAIPLMRIHRLKPTEAMRTV